MLNDDLVQRRISILVYEDPRWIHGELYAGDGVIWLHQVSPRFGLASPKTLGAATATTAVIVEDVDAPHRQARDAGADIVYPPVDQPYGHREYSARDPEGGLWSFMRCSNDLGQQGPRSRGCAQGAERLRARLVRPGMTGPGCSLRPQVE